MRRNTKVTKMWRISLPLTREVEVDTKKGKKKNATK